MPNLNYRKFSATGTKAVLIAPDNATHRLSLSTISTPKKVSGISLMNRRVEIKVTRSVDPRGTDCVDCTPINEPVSVTLVISGSTTVAAQQALALMKADAITAVDTAWDDLILVGAAPQESTGLVYHTEPNPAG